MTTLADYAHQRYPNHRVDVEAARIDLASHTTVAHVIGRTAGERLSDSIRGRIDPNRVATLVIQPTNPTVIKDGGEDKEGIADLPHKRLGAGAAVTGAILGVAVGVITGFAIGDVVAGVLLGIFCAIIGAVIGFMVSGGGRYAGEHAWEQEHHPDEAADLVAALLDDETAAKDVASEMSAFGIEDVRILNREGAWHTPNN